MTEGHLPQEVTLRPEDRVKLRASVCLKDILYILIWHSGDGMHVYSTLSKVIWQLRYHRERSATLLVIDREHGTVEEVQLDSVE